MKIQDLSQFPVTKKFVIIYNTDRSKFALVEQVKDGDLHVTWTNGQRPMVFHGFQPMVEWFLKFRPDMSKYITADTTTDVVRFTFRAN